MKNFVKIALLTSVISTGAFAAENAFYIKAEGGLSILSDVKLSDAEITLFGLEKDSKAKGANIGSGGIEVGYAVMDNLRIGVQFNYHFSPEYTVDGKETSNTLKNYGYVLADEAPNGNPPAVPTYKSKKSAKNTLDLLSGFAKLTVDVVDLDYCKLYVHGGVGASFVKSTTTAELKSDELKARLDAATVAAIADANIKKQAEAIQKDGVYKVEVKNDDKYSINMAFIGGAGISFDVSDNAAIDVGYQYGYYGKKAGTPKKAENAKEDPKEVELLEAITAHEIKAGIRFSF